MKRSSQLRLSLMAATLPVALVGCEDEPPTGRVLASPEQCTTVTEVSPAECRQAYEAAVAEHQRVAPRFASRVECDQEFDDCQVIEAEGQTYYVPPMGGFLLGYALASASRPGYYGYGGALPLYRSRSGGFYKPGGDLLTNRPGQVTGNKGLTTPPARAVTVSRSGFGSSAAARSSFGG